MAWLWLISVGVTDVQFPVWKRDEYGRWDGPFRFEIGRGGVRTVHEGLKVLLGQDQIVFPPEPLPKFLKREETQNIRLKFEQADDLFFARIETREGNSGAYKISGLKDEIPNDTESHLPLYCPKVAELLEVTRNTFAQEAVTVLVLNTRRDERFDDWASEPIASGPLVARFLAERLGLTSGQSHEESLDNGA